MENLEIHFVPVYRSRVRQRCKEYAFVLQAVGIRSEVIPADGEFALIVEARDADRAWEQLRLYRHEQQYRPARFDVRHGIQDGLVCASLFGVTMLITDMLAGSHSFSLDWLGAGMSHAGSIREGEWWRIFTSLSLHADVIHLAGNLVFGLVFAFFAGQLLGWGVAWSGMLLAGALGNAVNAFVQAPGHMSVGASTAVFATVGILAAYRWGKGQMRFKRWVPLGGGLALLAFLGMGGERTDIIAHVAGFGSGCLFGFVYWILERRIHPAAWTGNALGVAASVVFLLAWLLALRAHG